MSGAPDPARQAYIRNHGRWTRTAGFLCCLAGAMLLIWADRKGPGAHSPVGYAAVAIVAIGWAIFAYVIVQRTRYARAHPYHRGS